MKTRSLLIISVICVGLLLMSGAVSAQKKDKPPPEKKKLIENLMDYLMKFGQKSNGLTYSKSFSFG